MHSGHSIGEHTRVCGALLFLLFCCCFWNDRDINIRKKAKHSTAHWIRKSVICFNRRLKDISLFQIFKPKTHQNNINFDFIGLLDSRAISILLDVFAGSFSPSVRICCFLGRVRCCFACVCACVCKWLGSDSTNRAKYDNQNDIEWQKEER